ncbi:MAG: hypothetical protein EOO60_10940, partial [Hymenobacter sp.]
MEHLAKIISDLRASLPKRNKYAQRTVELLAARGQQFSRQHVYGVLSGRHFNADVAEAFISVVEAERERLVA